MPCNKNTKKCPYNDNGEMPKCCKQHLLETIGYTSWLLKLYGLKHWIDYGTLLGAVRERTIIPWDSDGDFGILGEDRELILSLKNKIKKDGFFLYKYSNELLQIGYSEKNWSYVDLWLNYIEPAHKHKSKHTTESLPSDFSAIDDRQINRGTKICRCFGPGAQMDHTGDFPYWFVEKTDTIRMHGYKLPVPRLREEFLTIRYGDWRIPVKKEDNYWGGNARTLRQSLEVVRRHKRTLG